jgi:hypothetical protein
MSRCYRLFGLAAVAALFVALPACGGDDDDDDVNVPDGGGGTGADSGGNGGDDGGDESAANLGVPCSESEACPGGEFCLVGADGVGFCSIECDMVGQIGPCQNEYAGPGGAVCLWSILDDEGNETGQNMCGVLCGAPENVCDPELCNGTCPGDLACLEAPMAPDLSVCTLSDDGGGGGGLDGGVAAPGRTLRAYRAAVRTVHGRLHR